MKTYAEKELKKPYNWNKMLELAMQGKARGAVRIHMNNMAGNWVTCACGNQCDIIPRDVDGVPEDEKLDSLGMRFLEEVLDMEWTEAKKTLRQIELRSAQLIKEIKCKSRTK